MRNGILAWYKAELLHLSGHFVISSSDWWFRYESRNGEFRYYLLHSADSRDCCLAWRLWQFKWEKLKRNNPVALLKTQTGEANVAQYERVGPDDFQSPASTVLLFCDLNLWICALFKVVVSAWGYWWVSRAKGKQQERYLQGCGGEGCHSSLTLLYTCSVR